MSQVNKILNPIVTELEATPETATLPLSAPPAANLGARLWQAVVGWGREEWQQWRRAFSGLAIYVLLLASLILLSLAWQSPFSYTLDTSTALNLDQPFMHNFNAIENTDPKTLKGNWFRWSKGEGTLAFAGVGRRDYSVQLNVAGSANPDPAYSLYANTQLIAQGKLEPGQKTYQFNVPASAISNKDGDLILTLKVPEFNPDKSDVRSLGFAFFSAKIEATSDGLILPPPNQLAALLGVILLAYVLLARAGFQTWRAAGGAGVLTLALTYGISTPGVRPWLTIFGTQLAFAFGWAVLMLVLLAIPMRRVWSNRWESRWALAIFGLALAVRLGGMLHPQAYHAVNEVDMGFHVNQMAVFWDAHLWWHKITSGEWGNRETYYPVTTYFLTGLFQWLISDRFLLLLVWMQTFEASRILLIYYLVKKTTGDGRSAVLAGFFMAVLPVNMLSLAWGQVANLFAEWLVLVALCLIVVKWDELRKPVYFAILTLTLLASFITHPGEVGISGLVFLLIGVVLWRRLGWRKSRLYLGIYILSVVLALASYHWMTVRDMVPEALDSISAKLNGTSVVSAVDPDAKTPTGIRVGGSVDDPGLGLPISYVHSLPEAVVEGFKGFWHEIRVYFDFFPVLMLPWALWWLWRTGRSSDEWSPFKQRLFWTGVVWTGVAIIFALVGLFLNLYVRYSLFMLPFVAIGAGLFLGRFWQRQRSAGQSWVALFLIFAFGSWIAFGTLTVFYDRLIYYLHGA